MYMCVYYVLEKSYLLVFDLQQLINIFFLQDEILIVIKRVDSNWIEGKKGEKIGIFFIFFVEVCCCYFLNLIYIKFIFGKVEL